MTNFLLPTSEPGVFDFHVDNSSKELFETCARAAEYYTVRRRELDAERGALNFGGVIHKALVPRKLASLSTEQGVEEYVQWQMNNHYIGLTFEQTQERIIIAAFTDHPVGLDEWRTPERAIEVIKLYNAEHPIDSEPFKVLPGTIELPFKLFLGKAELATTIFNTFVKDVNVYWTGRIDGLVSYDNQILVLDHKTSSVLGPTFYDDFVLSSQMHGYTWAARKLGYDAKGLLLDVLGLRKPTRTGKSTEFQRQRYFYPEEHLAEWDVDMFTHVTDFLEHLCRAYFPKSTKWCFGKYGQCQYWSVCSQLPQHREAMLNSDVYRDVTWSPLNPT